MTRIPSHNIAKNASTQCESLEPRVLFSTLPTVVDVRVNPANGHTYYLLSQSDWTDAESESQALGGHLVTINNSAENIWVQQTFEKEAGNLWLGLNDPTHSSASGPNRPFAWSDGEPITYGPYWASGQPDNAGGMEYYALMTTNNGQWHDFGNLTVDGSTPIMGVAEVNTRIDTPELDVTDENDNPLGATLDGFLLANNDEQSLTVTNNGDLPIRIAAGTIQLPAASDGRAFLLDKATLPANPILDPGQQTSFSILLDDRIVGSISGQLQINAADVNPTTNPAGFSLNGDVGGPGQPTLEMWSGAPAASNTPLTINQPVTLPDLFQGTGTQDFTFTSGNFGSVNLLLQTPTFTPISGQATLNTSAFTPGGTTVRQYTGPSGNPTMVLQVDTTNAGSVQATVTVQTGDPALAGDSNQPYGQFADPSLSRTNYQFSFTVDATIVPNFAVLSNRALTITGTAAADTIALTSDGTTLTATVNGAAQTFSQSAITSILVLGQAGNDTITIGANVPAAEVRGNMGADTIVSSNTLDTLKGGPGGDSLKSTAGHTDLRGNRGLDTLTGSATADSLTGGPGMDLLTSGGNALLLGGPGNDTLMAENNLPDTLNGGAGINAGAYDAGTDSVTLIQTILG